MVFHLWQSATIMSWGGVLVRILGLGLLLLLILSRFTAADVVVWQLFASFTALLLVIDMGFTPTFSRLIAYGMGGAKINEIVSIQNRTGPPLPQRDIDWITIQNVLVVMKRVYLVLGIISTVIYTSLGTWAVYDAILLSSDPGKAWIAWGIVILSSSLIVYNNYNVAFLQGVNRIAIMQRYQILISLLAVITTSLVVALNGDLLTVVFVYQFITITIVIANWTLVRRFNKPDVAILGVNDSRYTKDIWPTVWNSAWKSGIGILMSAGVIQLSGVAYAQLGNTLEVASYLLALHLIRSISAFSQAPFYTKLPEISKLYVKGDLTSIVLLGKRGMQFSYAVYVSVFIGVAMFFRPIVEMTGSNIEFPDKLLWSLLGLGFFFERFGAMHLQLYSASNHIVWHVANGFTGGIMIGVGWLLYPWLGVIAFPIAMIFGYLGFYCWYTSRLSYKKYKIKFLEFERLASGPAFLFLIIGTVVFICK